MPWVEKLTSIFFWAMCSILKVSIAKASCASLPILSLFWALKISAALLTSAVIFFSICGVISWMLSVWAKAEKVIKRARTERMLFIINGLVE